MAEGKRDTGGLDTVVEVDPTSGEFKLRLPGKLAVMAGRNLAKAVEMAFAGFAPAQYRRAVNGTLQSRLDTAMVNQMCRAIEDPDDRALAAALLRQSLISQAQKAESRAEILDLTAHHLAIEGPATRPEKDDISPDFLQHFWDTADRLSRSELREIFARILAREIASPQSFSASTLNVLATLHPRNAQKFEELCRMTFNIPDLSFVIVSLPANHKGPVNQLGTKPSGRIGEYLDEFGISREDLLDLQSIGLTRSAGEQEYPQLHKLYRKHLYVEYAGRTAHLVPSGSSPGGVNDAVGVISLTPTGRELRSVLLLEPHKDYTYALMNAYSRIGVTMTLDPLQPSNAGEH